MSKNSKKKLHPTKGNLTVVNYFNTRKKISKKKDPNVLRNIVRKWRDMLKSIKTIDCDNIYRKDFCDYTKAILDNNQNHKNIQTDLHKDKFEFSKGTIFFRINDKLIDILVLKKLYCMIYPYDIQRYVDIDFGYYDSIKSELPKCADIDTYISTRCCITYDTIMFLLFFDKLDITPCMTISGIQHVEENEANVFEIRGQTVDHVLICCKNNPTDKEGIIFESKIGESVEMRYSKDLLGSMRSFQKYRHTKKNYNKIVSSIMKYEPIIGKNKSHFSQKSMFVKNALDLIYCNAKILYEFAQKNGMLSTIYKLSK
jgi:hypothetical protein